MRAGHEERVQRGPSSAVLDAIRRAALSVGVVVGSALVVTLPGCTCEGGPYLGVTEAGGPAIGWRTQGTQLTQHVRLVDDAGITVWEIKSQSAPPTVIPIGEEVDGFHTTVAAEGDIVMTGHVLRLTYDQDGQTIDADWPFTEHAYEPSTQTAEVKEKKCANDLAGAVGRAFWFSILALLAAVAAVSAIILLTATGAHLRQRPGNPDD